MFNLQVILPDSLKGRWFHTTTVVHTDANYKRLVHFGGIDEYPEDGDPKKAQPLAEMTIMELGEWSVPHSHCCYGIHLIQFGHLTVQCVLCG